MFWFTVSLSYTYQQVFLNDKQIYNFDNNNPPSKSGPKGLRHKAGTDFWGGFERKLQKKVHNGSENSENKKKYGVV